MTSRFVLTPVFCACAISSFSLLALSSPVFMTEALGSASSALLRSAFSEQNVTGGLGLGAFLPGGKGDASLAQ